MIDPKIHGTAEAIELIADLRSQLAAVTKERNALGRDKKGVRMVNDTLYRELTAAREEAKAWKDLAAEAKNYLEGYKSDARGFHRDGLCAWVEEYSKALKRFPEPKGEL